MSAGAAWRADIAAKLRLALLRPERLPDLPHGDLDMLLRAARRAGVLAQIAARAATAGVVDRLPQTAVDQLVSAEIGAAAQKRVALWELDRVLAALNDLSDVRLVALKGCAYVLADLPNHHGRTFADVDLLVSRDRLEHVEARLLKRGWQSLKLSPYDQHYYREWTHELPPLAHPARGVEVDLHHNILPTTARLRPPSAALLERAVPIEGHRLYRLGDVDILIHSIVHLFYDSDLTDRLRELVDIDALWRHFLACNEQYPLEVAARARELGLERPVFHALRYASRLLETPVPDAVLRAARRQGPSAVTVRLMDGAVERGLLPQHPDRPSRSTKIARFALYLRSHWIRMPLALLVRHLSYKAFITVAGTGRRNGAATGQRKTA